MDDFTVRIHEFEWVFCKINETFLVNPKNPLYFCFFKNTEMQADYCTSVNLKDCFYSASEMYLISLSDKSK